MPLASIGAVARWQAVVEGQGIALSLVGMGVVFAALATLYAVMLLLWRFAGERAAPAPAPAPLPAAAPAPTEAVPPQVVAAIAAALRLERRRRERAVQVEAPPVGGWAASRRVEMIRRASAARRRT